MRERADRCAIHNIDVIFLNCGWRAISPKSSLAPNLVGDLRLYERELDDVKLFIQLTEIVSVLEIPFLHPYSDTRMWLPSEAKECAALGAEQHNY